MRQRQRQRKTACSTRPASVLSPWHRQQQRTQRLWEGTLRSSHLVLVAEALGVIAGHARVVHNGELVHASLPGGRDELGALGKVVVQLAGKGLIRAPGHEALLGKATNQPNQQPKPQPHAVLRLSAAGTQGMAHSSSQRVTWTHDGLLDTPFDCSGKAVRGSER